MTHDEHVLGCALAVQRIHGEAAPLHVASEIGRLALEGDAEGVAMWRSIARALDGVFRPAGSA